MKKVDCSECKHCIFEDLYNEPVCRKDNKWIPLKMTKEGFAIKKYCKDFEKWKYIK